MRFFNLLSVVPPLTVSAVTLLARTPSPEASAACKRISAGTAETQIWPTALASPNYLDAKTRYWSAANADLTPACAVFPTSAKEVSYIIQVLLEYPIVPFAMKSGGHNTNVGFSSVNWGVLISFSKLASTRISSDRKSADIEPGARWGDVITTLDPYGVAVVGGRIGDVGVGGLLLGGGLSYLSAQHGLACDNVINYEVVLANSSIVNANARVNSDLFWALKGGGNQFGIVTKFTLNTFPIGKVWGGIRSYDGTKASAVLNATQKFIQNVEDPKAAIIPNGELVIGGLVKVFVVFFFYNGETPPPGVFNMFDSIPSITNQVKTQSYANLLSATNIALYGSRYLYRTSTIPNLPGTNGTDLYNIIFNNWEAYIMSQAALLPGFIFSISYQPLQALIAKGSVAAGGNALVLDPGDGDRVWIDLSISWITAVGDGIAETLAKKLTSDIDNYTKSQYSGVPNTRYVQGSLDYVKHNPIFANDAMYDQKPYQTYGDNAYTRLKAIQRRVDPDGFFNMRTGGFKYA